MKIPSEYLKGFLEICRRRNITAAAKTLGLTQAALTLRLQNLENVLEETLLIRHKTGVVLTETGRRLLEHAELIEDLENECLSELHHEGDVRGTLRVGCFSTIGRSLVMPALTPLLRKYPKIGLHFAVKELQELSGLLSSGEMDIIFLDRELNREGVENIHLGNEEYVFITSKDKKNSADIYLNHDEEDLMSFRYWEHLGTPKSRLQRRYLDEIYSVIDGVAAGIGVSILPKHLIKEDERIKVVSPAKFFPNPVYMVMKKRAWRPKHLELAADALNSHLRKHLM